MTGVSLANVGVSLGAKVSLVTATIQMPAGGESLLGIKVSLIAGGHVSSTMGLNFTIPSNSMYLTLFGGFA
jgi:hypothetical protein